MRFLVLLARNRFDIAAIEIETATSEEATAEIQRQIDAGQISESAWELGADADKPVIVAVEIVPGGHGRIM